MVFISEMETEVRKCGEHTAEKARTEAELCVKEGWRDGSVVTSTALAAFPEN